MADFHSTNLSRRMSTKNTADHCKSNSEMGYSKFLKNYLIEEQSGSPIYFTLQSGALICS